VWTEYKKVHKNWKKLLMKLSEFLEGKLYVEREILPVYDSKMLKLVAIDFIS
jgi:hypothetical protein